MNLREDDRAVSEVFGTILVIGLVMLAIGLIQANAVPTWNEKVEFEHNQHVQTDLRQMDSAISNVFSTALSRSVTIELGTRYPTRTIFLNPPPASGNLRTVSDINDTQMELLLTNVTARDGETADYMSGDVGPFQSRSIEYRPSYNHYTSPPTTRYEHTILYNRFTDDSIVLDGGTLINGRQVLLPVIAGNMSRSGSDTTTVSIEPISSPPNAVSVTNTDSDSITLTLTTGLSEVAWRTEILVDEYDPDGVNGSKYVQSITCLEHNRPSEPCNGDLRITLEADTTYELRMAKVGLGGRFDEEPAHYITTVRGDDSSISEDGSTKLVVEVRDRYNNPVSGTRVNVSAVSGSAGGTVTPSNATTDGSGRAVFVFEPNSTGQATLTLDISRNPIAREEVTFNVDVVNATKSTETAYTIQWDTAAIETEDGVVDCAESSCTYDRKADTADDVLTLLANTSPTAIGADVDFSINDTSIATLENESTETNDAGETTADLNTTTDENTTTDGVTVYVSSGGGTDTLHLTILDPDVAPTIDTFDIIDGSNPGIGARFDVDWNVSDADGDLDSLNITLTDSSGNVVDSVKPAISGTSESGQSTLEDAGGYGETFTIEITVTDAQGNSETASKNVTA